MKTANNLIAGENPAGTGLLVSNNTLSIWDSVATTTTSTSTSTSTSTTTSTTITESTTTISTTSSTEPPSISHLVTFVISS